MTGKWILISGGNSGIGREASIQLAKWGANIVMACRPNPPPREPSPDSAVEDCKHAAKSAGHLDSVIEWWPVDMSSLSSVSALAQRWLNTSRPLDVLCNNAGLSSTINKTIITDDGFELIHQVNFLSHVLMTLSLLPALAKATAPRVLCTTSNMQYMGIFNLANSNAGTELSYAHNKLYFQVWLTELQARLAHSPEFKHIVVHGLHPGYVMTNIWNPLTKENVKEMSFGEWFLGKLLPYVGITAQQGSLCITNAATNPAWGLDALKPDPEDGIVGAKFLNRVWECESMPHTRHPECRKMVWEFVDEELKLGDQGLLKGL